MTTHSKHYPQWWKIESISSKVKNKTRVPTFTITIQHSFERFGHSNRSTCIFLNDGFRFLQIHAQEQDCWIRWQLFVVDWGTFMLFSTVAVPVYWQDRDFGLNLATCWMGWVVLSLDHGEIKNAGESVLKPYLCTVEEEPLRKWKSFASLLPASSSARSSLFWRFQPSLVGPSTSLTAAAVDFNFGSFAVFLDSLKCGSL